MVIPLEARGGVLDGMSHKPAMGCSVVRCLFREWLEGVGGGGVRSLPWVLVVGLLIEHQARIG